MISFFFFVGAHYSLPDLFCCVRDLGVRFSCSNRTSLIPLHHAPV